MVDKVFIMNIFNFLLKFIYPCNINQQVIPFVNYYFKKKVCFLLSRLKRISSILNTSNTLNHFNVQYSAEPSQINQCPFQNDDYSCTAYLEYSCIKPQYNDSKI